MTRDPEELGPTRRAEIVAEILAERAERERLYNQAYSRDYRAGKRRRKK